MLFDTYLRILCVIVGFDHSTVPPLTIFVLPPAR